MKIRLKDIDKFSGLIILCYLWTRHSLTDDERTGLQKHISTEIENKNHRYIFHEVIGITRNLLKEFLETYIPTTSNNTPQHNPSFANYKTPTYMFNLNAMGKHAMIDYERKVLNIMRTITTCRRKYSSNERPRSRGFC